MERTKLTVQDGVAVILMNDPARLNPLDIAMDDELLARFTACEEDPAVKTVVIGGEGRALCVSSGSSWRRAGMTGWTRC